MKSCPTPTQILDIAAAQTLRFLSEGKPIHPAVREAAEQFVRSTKP